MVESWVAPVAAALVKAGADERTAGPRPGSAARDHVSARPDDGTGLDDQRHVRGWRVTVGARGTHTPVWWLRAPTIDYGTRGRSGQFTSGIRNIFRAKMTATSSADTPGRGRWASAGRRPRAATATDPGYLPGGTCW
jgi:hypothetical protein